MTKDPIDIGLNKEMIINILVKGRPVGISLQLDDLQTGVVIMAGDEMYKHLIPQMKE